MFLGFNPASEQLYRETIAKEQGTNINNHRKLNNSFKVSAISAGIVIIIFALSLLQ